MRDISASHNELQFLRISQRYFLWNEQEARSRTSAITLTKHITSHRLHESFALGMCYAADHAHVVHGFIQLAVGLITKYNKTQAWQVQQPHMVYLQLAIYYVQCTIHLFWSLCLLGATECVHSLCCSGVESIPGIVFFFQHNHSSNSDAKCCVLHSEQFDKNQ